VALAAGASHVIESMLFGVTSTDLSTFLQVGGVVAAVAAPCCAMPALQQGRSSSTVLNPE